MTISTSLPSQAEAGSEIRPCRVVIVLSVS